MAQMLYLHETVDIVGQGAVPYMEHTAGFHAETAADRGLTLFGTWYVVGATGRWPQVVNLWELLDGWEGWERLIRSTNLRRRENTELAQWWDEAYQWRTGGVDRLLAGAAGCPTLDQLLTDEVVGELFVHERSEVRPGAALDYLEATLSERAPLLAERGHRLVGAYEAVLCDTEVVTVWATDLRSHVALMQARQDGDRHLEAWRTSASSWLTHRHEELMVPLPGTPLAPG